MEELVLSEKTRAKIGGSFIELSDGWTHYEYCGPAKGKTIVFVHGNAAPMFSWDRNMDAFLNAGFKILRYDIFGHGFSDRPEFAEYNKDLYDRQLDELIENLGITKPFCMAGTSQGGSIAVHYAACRPGSVQKIALLSPLFDEFSGKIVAGLIKGRFGDFIMRKTGEKMMADPSRVLVTDVFRDELTDKLKSQLRYKGKKGAVLANMRGDSFEDNCDSYKKLKEQKIPVFLSWGCDDNSIPQRSMKRLRKLIPEIEYHQLDRAGHLAHYEFADIMNPLLIQFFTGN